MENKINVAELLKDIPSGTELDCTMYEDVYFDYIDELCNIYCYIKNEDFRTSIMFNRHGRPIGNVKSKCVIFPKGKTTWKGFVPHSQFKDGDIITDSIGTCIFKGEGRIEGTVDYYCGVRSDGSCFSVKDNKRRPDGHYGFIVNYRFATEEEKQKLFDAIKANGYKWNPETKTPEKLIEPKFKIGDKIRSIISLSYYTIVDIKNDQYFIKPDDAEKFPYHVPVIYETNYELVPDKFDITSLVPFESRVLVRSSYGDIWRPAIYGFTDSEKHYVVGGNYWAQCIPYEGNEYLRGKTDDCDNFYKTWREWE